MGKKGLKRFMVAALLVALIILFHFFHFEEYFSIAHLKALLSELSGMYAASPFIVVSAYMIVYISIAALGVPGAVPMTLLGGAVFGFWTGALIVSFASTIGATASFVLSRYLLRDWVQRVFGEKLSAINRGVEEEGAFYLFSLRLVPIFPFVAINFAMGVTPMPVRTFYIVSQIGMLPGTMVYVNAGRRLAGLESASGILSPALILSFALIAIFPFVVKRLLSVYRKRKNIKTINRE